MTIQTVELSTLKPPAANPRTGFDEDTIRGLATSIRTDGVLQNLVVEPVKGRGRGYRIISGERRFRALQLLKKEGEIGADFAVPVEIRDGLSKDEAARIATVENVQRENLPPMDEARAFKKLVHDGVTLGEIAAQTGLSAATITRRLALNSLCDEAQEALSEGALSLSCAEALTIGTHDEQRRLLRTAMKGGHHSSPERLKAALTSGKPSLATAIFPREQYKGTFTKELFADDETTYFDDVDQFMLLQDAAVRVLAASHLEKADWVEITDHYAIRDWLYEQAEDPETGGVLINLAPSGRVDIRENLKRPEIDEDTMAEIADSPVAPKRAKASYSTPLRRYIAWHKSAAIAELLLADPRKAREAEIVHRLANLKIHEGITQLARQEEPGSAYAVIAAQVRLFAGWLGIEIADDEPLWEQFPPRFADECALYESVKGLSDHKLEQLHTLLSALTFGQATCESLDTGDSLFNRVAADLDADMRHHWKPDRSFLERRSREQLLVIAEQCGCGEAYGIGLLRTYKKSELVGCLLRHFTNAHAASEPTEAQQKARDWLPEAMNFPSIDPDAAKAEPSEVDPQDDEHDITEAA